MIRKDCKAKRCNANICGKRLLLCNIKFGKDLITVISAENICHVFKQIIVY